MNIQLMTLDAMLASISIQAMDEGDDQWPLRNKKEAVKSALRSWDNKVLIPHVHDLDALSSSNGVMSIPSWVDTRYLDVLFYRNDQWMPSLYWDDVSDDDGPSIQVHSLPAGTRIRLNYWLPQCVIPVIKPIVVSDNDSEFTINTQDAIPPYGYIYCESEWMGYSGIDDVGQEYVLKNVRRGLNSTRKATHLSGTDVQWGIAADRADLYNVLQDESIAWLSKQLLFSHRAVNVEDHRWNMRYNDQAREEFWQKYTPSRAPRVKLSRPIVRGPL